MRKKEMGKTKKRAIMESLYKSVFIISYYMTQSIAQSFSIYEPNYWKDEIKNVS